MELFLFSIFCPVIHGYLIFFILQGHYGMVNQVIFVA
jgi:hypothetical protein